jgi:hypothetical protein
MLRTILGHVEEKMEGSREKLHNKDLHNSHSSYNRRADQK